MAEERVRKIGALEDVAFSDASYYLWRCNDCKMYFAAGDPRDNLLIDIVGLFTAEAVYEQNRKLNPMRARWAAARERNDVCTCIYHAHWPTKDGLHLRLPESREEPDPYIDDGNRT